MFHSILCPAACLDQFAIRSKFHLILPHLLDKLPQYKEFYKERAKQGDHILLDNSIFEHGYSFDYKKMIKYAEEMELTEISAPEVLKDREASLVLREEFLNYYVKSGSKVKILAVAQGKNLEEVEESYFELLRIPEITTLGLPFDLDDQGDSAYSGGERIRSLTLRRVVNRWGLVDRINAISYSKGIELKPTHLMGLSDAVELQKYKDFPWIRSNDSSTAFVHGVNLIKYTDRGLPCEKISQKLDFAGWKILHPQQVEFINYNIDKILSWI
jgi:sulfur carrier protein ThiS